MRLPNVLLIDDKDAELEADAVAQAKRVTISPAYPEEVEIDEIKTADLVIVDLDLKEWKERNGTPVARNPANGLALIPILRESLRESKAPPPGFAVLTNQLNNLAGHYLPDDYREHALARLHNIEWAFEKDDETKGNRISELAEAIRDLPREWPEDRRKTFSMLGEYLGLQAFDITDDDPTYRALSRCNPPVHEYSQNSHGISVLRWLLHRILPYPTFLMSEYDLAERLGVDPDILQSKLEKQPGFEEDLSAYRYRGALSEFLGKRWWAHLTSAWFWELTDGQTPSADRVRNALIERYKFELPASEAGPSGVLVYDHELKQKSRLVSIDKCVRIEPDDWPPFARYAYAEREDIVASELLTLIATSEEVSEN